MFVIFHDDKPIYEYNFLKQEKLQTYFVIHAALDTVDYTAPKRREFYLGLLKNDDLPIFCYINPTGLRLLLAFTVKVEGGKDIDKAINGFFTEANRYLANVLMNPLYKQKDEIKSPFF